MKRKSSGITALREKNPSAERFFKYVPSKTTFELSAEIIVGISVSCVKGFKLDRYFYQFGWNRDVLVPLFGMSFFVFVNNELYRRN